MVKCNSFPSEKALNLLLFSAVGGCGAMDTKIWSKHKHLLASVNPQNISHMTTLLGEI